MTDWRTFRGERGFVMTGLTAYTLAQWLARTVGEIDAPGCTVEVWGEPTPRLDDPEGHDDAVITLRSTAEDGRVDLLLIEVHGKTLVDETPNAMAIRTPLSAVRSDAPRRHYVGAFHAIGCHALHDPNTSPCPPPGAAP